MARVVRPLDLGALLRSDDNPQIELNLNSWEESSRNFMKALATFKHRTMSEINARRNAHEAEVKKIADRSAAVVKETEACKVRELELAATLERENEERNEAETSVASLKRQLTSLRTQCDTTGGELEQFRATTKILRSEKTQENSILAQRSSRASPALDACEEELAFVVEGLPRGRLLVRFGGVDPYDMARECTAVLDFTGQEHRVITTTPHLPTLPLLVKELNHARDIYGFVVKLRQAFQEQASGR